MIISGLVSVCSARCILFFAPRALTRVAKGSFPGQRAAALGSLGQVHCLSGTTQYEDICMRLGRFAIEPLSLLLVFIPVALLLELMHASPVLVFVASSCAIVPLAGYMGKATEHLTERTGPGIGGLLNATFGNAAELII